MTKSEIENKITTKLYKCKVIYPAPEYYSGKHIREVLNDLLISNKELSLILTANSVHKSLGIGNGRGNRRGTHYTLGIFETSKQVGYEEGENMYEVITNCVAQVLEILPRAKCKGKLEENDEYEFQKVF